MAKLTQSMLIRWGGTDVFRDAESLLKQGGVLRAEREEGWIKGAIARGTHTLNTRFKVLPTGAVESQCPCWANREQGLVCVHVVAGALCILRRQTDPRREQKYQEEQRRARRLAELDPRRYHQRVERDTPNARSANIELTLPDDWSGVYEDTGRVPLICRFGFADRSTSPEATPVDIPLYLPRQDDALLYVIEDICEGPARGTLALTIADFINILNVWRGRSMERENAKALPVRVDAAHTALNLSMDEAGGDVILRLITTLAGGKRTENTHFLVHNNKGWVYAEDAFFPLNRVLPLPYHGVYRQQITIGHDHLAPFLSREMTALSEWIDPSGTLTPDMLLIEPGNPTFNLTLRGSPASVAAELRAQYGSYIEAPGAPSSEAGFAIPAEDDLLHFFGRNEPAENRALERLAALGFKGNRGDRLAPITGTREVLNLLGSGVAVLRRLGWKIQFEGRIAQQAEELDRVTPVVNVEDNGKNGFEIGFVFEAPGGEPVTPGDVQRALLRGDAFLEHRGQTLLLDGDAIESMRAVFRDCASSEGGRTGSFRVSAVHAPFVCSSLQALDGIDVEQPPAWRERCSRQNREAEMGPIALPDGLDKVLRPYQKTGVAWLRFLETNGFCGILADEMGLGKTLQTLVWLKMNRQKDNRSFPALIVCPTSLVENWAREAERFVPDLRCVVLSGAQRHALWESLPDNDLAITSYALLRRDLDRYRELQLSAAILDEAQHIKNRSTQNAQAAKQLQARHRLVLTGTPVENSVADLWSIMDFLMPGYLGSYPVFREQYELPITRDDSDGERAQARLRRKLHPFLLRRRKKDVARDLPAKLEKVSFCTLSPNQQKVYNTLLAESQRKVGNLVAEQGFERSRMAILAMLMRLRQVCCHLELLPKAPGATAGVEEPSAKTDQLLELLDEAMDGGHRMLVFSQFTSMLRILRRELDARSIDYTYLDGATKDRMNVVQKFNRERGIPVFLISLKAGGTGLNLTGADMVVHFDPWWNPAVENQATDRAHRIGQQRTVYSIKLIAEHTIEESVLALQQRKQRIIDRTVDHEQGEGGAISWKDVQEILRL